MSRRLTEASTGWVIAQRLARSVRTLVPLLAILCGVAAASHFGVLQPLKAALYELRFNLTPRPPTGDIVLVEIDSKSIAAVGTWPWPRRIHAALVDALTASGVDQIAFDVDFSSPSTDEQDRILEDALRRAGGTVVLAAFRQKLSGDPADRRMIDNRPLPRFADNAWSGTVNVFADRDGIVRKVSTGHLVAGEPTLSMPMLLANGAAELGREFLIDFGIRAPAIDRLSAIDVLDKKVDGRRLAGKKVILGASAIELRDFFHVPVFGIIPGPLVQALGAETILQGRMLAETGSPLSLSLASLILCLAALGASRVRWSTGLAMIAGGALIAEAAGLVTFRIAPLLLDTSALQATFACLAVLGALREIDFSRLLLAISRRETRDTKTILDQVVADNFAGVIVATEDGIIQAASRKAADLFKIGCPDELVGRSIDDTLPMALAQIIWNSIGKFRDGCWQPREPGNFEYARSGDDTSVLEYVVTPSRLETGERGGAEASRIVASLTFVDITERRHAEARVAYMARFDTLTGLPNHNQFAEKLALGIESGQSRGDRSTLFYFDLDRFKSINDTLGRNYGDILLRDVAKRVLSIVRPTDFVARLDGDQFVILRSDCANPENSRAFAAELIAKLTEPYSLNGHRAVVSVSVGVATGEAFNQDAAALMKNAETAHHRAKMAGGHSVAFFDPARDLGLRLRQALEVEMRDALDRGEFWVAYQPQVDLATNRLIGVEALLRWQHPQRGLVSPADFVPVAEDTGFILALGQWVLQRACRDAASWPTPIKVAVNLSPIQFARGDLVTTVASALQSSGLPHAQLDLEITESLFIRESSEIMSVTDELRRMGVTFSLDDFGTGYSSLNYLRKFQVHKIKLDRSFVSGLPLNPESVAIVRAVCALAQDLGVRTNAEGIETEEQMTSLRLLGCKEGQGHLLGKPQKAEEIARLLQGPIAPDKAAA